MAQQRYHVIERIDAGGMAEVFKANSTSLQGFEKLVAIKRILPDLTKNERFVRMFLDEAKVSLHLNHTNCVQVFDLGLADSTYFIVMEFVDGTNLKNIIELLKAQGKAISTEQVAYIALEICKGLAHAHNKKDQQNNHLGIVHRDISPPNVLISSEGEVKITDFGLAKAKSQVETTDPGIVKGKFGYLSPEAAHGEAVDARTDVFAVGILMWEMLTGTRLFLGESDIDTLQLVRKNKVPPLSKFRSDVPPEFEAIIRHALESDIQKRYQTAEELGRAVSSFLFSYGRPVTSFDIAGFVKHYRAHKSPPKRTEKDKAVDAEIQAAVNRIVSLEEVEDLDLYLASQYGKFESEGGGEFGDDGSFEDPRLWADFGLDDVSVREAPVSEDEAWQERGLDEIMRRRQTYPGGHPTISPEEATLEVNPQVAQDAIRHAQRAAGRPGADVPLHQRGPQRGATPDRSIELAHDIQGQAEFVPAAQAKAEAAAKRSGTTQEIKVKKEGSKTVMIVVSVLILLCVLAVIGVVMTQG